MMAALRRWRDVLAGLAGGAAFLFFHLALGRDGTAVLAGLAAAVATYAGVRLVLPAPGRPGEGGRAPVLDRAWVQLTRLADLLPMLDAPVATPVAALLEAGIIAAGSAEAGGDLPLPARRLLTTHLETTLRIVEHHAALRRRGFADQSPRVARVLDDLLLWVRDEEQKGADGVTQALNAELAFLDRMLAAYKQP